MQTILAGLRGVPALLGFLALPLFANGIIIPVPPPVVIVPPPGPPRPEPVRPLIVKQDLVSVRIEGSVCRIEVDETFYNPNPRQLEGTYLFPLPEGATVAEFMLYIDGEPVKAELLDADKARQVYEDTVRRMIDPALLEFAGRNLFKARVFPIPANGSRRVVLKYTETLTPDASVWTFRYPLSVAKFSPQPVETVRLSIEADARRKVSSVYSTSHPEGQIERKGDTEFRYVYEAHNVTPDKDFFLHFVTARSDIVAAPLVHRVADEDGFVMLLISASEAAEKEGVPKDIVFVADTSGSMRDGKIKQAKSALKFCVEGLGESDRFEVISFSTEARPVFGGLREASEVNRKVALGRIEELSATGGTNIEEALRLALKALEAGDAARPRFVIFLTDGRPTVGETTTDGIMKQLVGRTGGARFFVFGVGDDLNAILLDRIAADTKGAKTYVGADEDLELKLSGFYSKISRPALTDVGIEAKGVQLYDLYPREIGDIFYGQELVVMARVKGEGDAEILVRGKRTGKPLEYRQQAAFAADAKCPGLPLLWAARKVAHLLEEIRLEGETPNLKKEVVELAKKYGIITPYTSMLVIEDEGVARPGQPVPPAAPAPLQAANIRGRAEAARRGYAADVGAAAVEASKRLAEMGAVGARAPAAGPSATLGVGEGGRFERSKAESLYDIVLMKELRDQVKRVGDKTFYKTGEYWQDSTYKHDMKTIEIEYLGDEYFKLLSKHPELGQYFAIGRYVVVVWKGTAYRVK